MKKNKDILSKDLVNKLQKRVSLFNKDEDDEKFANLISNVNLIELSKRKERKNKKRIDLYIDLTGNFKKISDGGCNYIYLQSDDRVRIKDYLFYTFSRPVQISYDFLFERALLKRRKRLLDSMLNKITITPYEDSEEIDSMNNFKI